MNSKDESFTVSKTSADLLDVWDRCTRSTQKLKRELSDAERSERDAENALGKWMCPPDAKYDEMFHMWVCDGLLTIKKVDDTTYKLWWRIKPTRTR